MGHMTDARSAYETGSPDPDWGLGATADPIALGAAMSALGRRLASDPGLVAGSMLRFAAGLAEVGAVVAARAIGSSADGPIET